MFGRKKAPPAPLALAEREASKTLGAEADAQRRLGERLLVGRDIAVDPKQGAALIAAAASRGDAEASRLMAGLAGAGALMAQSWTRALDFLADAAEQGSEDARGQLRLLAGRPGRDWRVMRHEVDLDAWLAPPARKPICEQPRIRIAEKFCTPEVCDWIIAAARRELKPGLMYDNSAQSPVQAEMRKCTEHQFDILDSDVVLLLVRARIATLTKTPVGALEAPQVFHYEVGDEIKPHYDFAAADEGQVGRGGATGVQRIVSSLIYLNDDYEGGELEFVKAKVRHRGRKGDIVYFANVDPSGAPDPWTLHAGRPVTRGEKWLFSQWIRNQAVVPA